MVGNENSRFRFIILTRGLLIFDPANGVEQLHIIETTFAFGALDMHLHFTGGAYLYFQLMFCSQFYPSLP